MVTTRSCCEPSSGRSRGDYRRRWSVALAAWLLLALPAWAAPGPETAPLRDYFREVWTTRNGLPHNTVTAITQTPDGYLWFGTWEGAVRFNGREFVNFDRERVPGLPDSAIRALHLDSDGALLLGGARGGLMRHFGEDWSAYAPAPTMITRLLRDDRGQLWVGTESSGVLRLDPDGQRRVYSSATGLPGDTALTLAKDPSGRIWIGGSQGLAYADGDRLLALPAASGLPQSPILALALDAQRRLLVGTEHGVFIARDPKRWMDFEILDASLRDETATQLLTDRRGDLWIGTLNRGLLRLSARGLEQLGIRDGLPNGRVTSLFEDREGNLWIGTNGGLTRLSDAPFANLTQDGGLVDNYVRTVLAHSDGSLWLGSARGLNRVDDQGVALIQSEALAGQTVLSLAEAPGANGIWIGSYTQGAMRWLDGRIVEHYRREDGLAGNEVRALLPARDGSLWVGSTDGLSRVRPSGIDNYGKDDGLPSPYVVALLESQLGEVWVGTFAGVAIIGKDGVRSLDLGRVNDTQSVFAFLEDRPADVIWMATDRGLIRYRASDGQLAAVDRKAGLPFDKIFGLVADHQGNFWLTGNRGAVRIRRADAEAVADGKVEQLAFERYTESDGMASAQCNGGSSPSVALRGDGSIWIATAAGAAHVQPERLADFSAVPPPVVIESFQVDGRDQRLDQDQTLDAGSQRLVFQFAGLSYVMSQRIRYRYRLLGFDHDWVERDTLPHAEFTNLPPGDYELRVAAAHPNGAWSTEQAALRFSQAPFLWQRSGFWIAAGAGLIGLLTLAVRWRLRSLQANERRLRELVESRTADLQLQTKLLVAADAEKSTLLEQLRQQSEAFARQAREDALTGLTNRRAFDEALTQEFARAQRNQSTLCLALLDIDHFKRVNDNWSHAVGDEALKALTEVLRKHFRSIDTVARWGGEEFAILLPYTELDAARHACERLRAAVAAIDCEHFAPGLHLTISIGIASHIGLSHHEKLVSRADAELYQAKQEGRNRVCG